jgi:hypothetical protein
MQIPSIKSVLASDRYLNGDDLLNLYTDTPFGNMTLKWFDIVQRLSHINDTIAKLYQNFYELKEERDNPSRKSFIIDSKKSAGERHFSEEIIYWLRKTTDELIGLLYISYYKRKYKEYPQKLKVSSIGDFLKTTTSFDEVLNSNRQFLKTLNEISNAFKHSFINHETASLRGTNEPVAFALKLDYNNLANKHQFYTVSLASIIENFDALISKIKQKLAVEFTY